MRPPPAPPRAALWPAAATGAALTLLVALNLGWGLPVGDLTRDPTAVMGAPFYTGFLSQLGVLVWSAAGVVCLFTARLLRGAPGARDWRPFLWVSGGFTLVLALDDLFLFHDEVAPQVLGLPEGVVVGAYGLALGGYLYAFRGRLPRTPLRLLGIALGLLAGSVALDALPSLLLAAGASPGDASPRVVSLYFLLEDGAKFGGIAFWLAYFASTCARIAAPAPLAAGGTPPPVADPPFALPQIPKGFSQLQ